jgi:hypothetical protein
MLLSMQRNTMYRFQFRRNQYTAEIETCGTLAMRYPNFFLSIDSNFCKALIHSSFCCDIHVHLNFHVPIIEIDMGNIIQCYWFSASLAR